MSEVMFVCTHCPRPIGKDYEDYKHEIGQMKQMEYRCPKCGVCRSCGHDPTVDEELYLTGGSD